MQSPSRTPTTPSLLAASSPSLLLSRSRLRLVASMFRQMCDAVEACHAQSVFHRDIKPENFIVTESTSTPCSTTDPNPTTPIRPSASRRASAMSIAAASSHAMSRPSSSTPTRRVVVKLTDFGLSTRDHESADMDCGSAPYMSYECRNNVAPTYRPKHADVWSLGIVLINMLYHHNPWTDTLLPAKSDPYKGGACSSFLQYLQNPVQFFLTRFTGMTLPAARFLAERVFCVPDDDRCSANEFAEWVSGTGAYAVNIPSTSYRPSSSSSMSASEDRYGRGGLGVVFGVETRPRTTSIVLAHRISAASIPPSRRPSSRASFAPSLNVGHIAAEPEFDQTQDFSADVCVSQAPLHRRASSDAGDSVASGMFVTSRSTSTKRRKRGTRRGKGNNGSQTPTSVAGGHEPGAMVDVLAEASQQLAREISRVSAPKAESLNIEEVPRERVPSAGLPSTSSLRSGNSRQSVASAHSGSSGTMSTSRRSRRTPFEPPSMYGIPEPLCTNNAAPATRPPSGKVATTRKITQNVSTSTSSLQGKKQSKWKLSFGKSQLPPVADDGASTMSMDFANTDNMSIASFGMGSGPMGQFSSPPRELSPPRAHGPRPPREASPSPSIRVEPRPHMSVAAANVTDLIMGLNAPPATPSTPSTGQSASFSLDATSVRGRRTLDGGSPHSRPRNFGSPSPSRGRASAASSIYSDYVPPVPPLPHSKGAAPPIFAKTPSPHRGGGVDANWASLSGASLEVPVGSNQASLPAKPVKISSGRGGSGNWRNSMSSTATGTTSATTSTTQFTRYSNGSRGSVSTTATSVSAGSWRAGGGGSISSGHSGKTSPTSIASNVNGKGGYQTLPRNIKVMNGVPGILHELPRGQNPSFDGYAQQQRKQRTRKQPKDLTLDTINERPTASTSAQKSPIAEGPAGRLADAATSTTDLDGVEYDGQKKVQRGQINALAKMLSALRR
ncbi:hypothetical protein BD626DRAFT_391407 [Schizophyllum amplum]|uniref:Protein kinase domain-containing protein n=1 Tax=Schizophyllum amplum TaxID=97359 RepID=A0A550CY28_9AGAR|nr:hypothetical protein BD626DRAFT_391407 [Auriculariopsis ampla]